MCDNYSWDQDLWKLAELKKWKEILDLGEYVSIEEKSRYLWAWPTLDNLEFLNKILNELKITRILSIGCGSGLLEWILHQSIGIPVNGLELDHSWWKCCYSPKTFIPLNFTDVQITSELLLKSSSINEWNFALLFCYFNNGQAFNEYINAYHGNYLIIIGPGDNVGRHTDPMPFEPKFDNINTWKLFSSSEIGNTKDFIVIYIRNNK